MTQPSEETDRPEFPQAGVEALTGMVPPAVGGVATGTYAEIVGVEAAERYFKALEANRDESYRFAIRRFGPMSSAALRLNRKMRGR